MKSGHPYIITASPKIISKYGIAIVVGVNYGIRLVHNVPITTTPVATIFLLKPVRIAMMRLSKKVCACLSLIRKSSSLPTEDHEMN